MDKFDSDEIASIQDYFRKILKKKKHWFLKPDITKAHERIEREKLIFLYFINERKRVKLR